MKDVKVDVRVNVDVDTASVVLLFASAAMALFFYKQNKQNRHDQAISHSFHGKPESATH